MTADPRLVSASSRGFGGVWEDDSPLLQLDRARTEVVIHMAQSRVRVLSE
jgi:hypothetical protein